MFPIPVLQFEMRIFFVGRGLSRGLRRPSCPQDVQVATVGTSSTAKPCGRAFCQLFFLLFSAPRRLSFCPPPWRAEQKTDVSRLDGTIRYDVFRHDLLFTACHSCPFVAPHTLGSTSNHREGWLGWL